MESPTQLFDDIARLTQQFKLSGTELDRLLNARRKDLEAMLEAGRIAQSGVQSLAQKQSEMLRTAVEELRGVLAANPDATGNQLNTIRQVAGRAITNVSELAEIALQSQSQAFDTVRKRAQEDIDELKSLITGTR
ncbi:MAG: phasin family protein [Rhodocyclaceae bacterium]|nr:phasin family protein [Rhodocyclaceae bacterium]